MPSNNITLDFKVDKLLNKLELLDKKVDKNSKDIEDLKKSVNMGRGSIRTLIIMGGLATAIVTLFKIFAGQQ
tara:strand:+ start:2411 stop:2626 length:216 start_codon:yes stop_codon:yes gene_type:complete